MYTLENKKLLVSINAIGAELSSIKAKENNKELLWQGNPEIWGSQAPVLFPIIGGLKNGTYHHLDKTYSLPKHGFIRYNTGLVVSKLSKTKITFSLESSAKTRSAYPFDFLFEISFELQGNDIKIEHNIKNKGVETMYFSVGGHPAFNCPLDTSEDYTDYYIAIEKKGITPSYILNDQGLISNKTISVFDEDKIWLTPTLFDNDALIFKNIQAKKATLTHKTKGAILSVTLEDFPDLGIWAKPNAPYVCIEPWLGYADVEDTNQHLKNKEGIQKLSKGDVHKSSYVISVL